MVMNIIYIDWDYEITEEEAKERVNKYVKSLKIKPLYIYYRKSSNGHAHLKLVFINDIDVFEHFMIRAIFYDDPKRIRADLMRYYLFRDETKVNRIFTAKMNKEGVKFVGEWKLIWS
ncbi:hypothetical protein SBV1_gp38 [Sulfolobales Beppu virus 1]|nr:hypothetical protein SBV1_gp38 [Sulfolobales Beppu virus 1]